MPSNTVHCGAFHPSAPPHTLVPLPTSFWSLHPRVQKNSQTSPQLASSVQPPVTFIQTLLYGSADWVLTRRHFGPFGKKEEAGIKISVRFPGYPTVKHPLSYSNLFCLPSFSVLPAPTPAPPGASSLLLNPRCGFPVHHITARGQCLRVA